MQRGRDLIQKIRDEYLGANEKEARLCVQEVILLVEYSPGSSGYLRALADFEDGQKRRVT